MRRYSFTPSRPAMVLALAAALVVPATTMAGAQTMLAARDTALPSTLSSGTSGTLPSNERTWHGTITGGISGTVTMTIERIGVPDDVANPVWPVLTVWRIESTDPTKSFSAELYGQGYENGNMHLSGVVTEGYRKGAAVSIDVRGQGNGKVQIRLGA